MFATIGRSWEFAKISYGIIWDYKQLLVFPVVSAEAVGLVLASFAAPLWFSGIIETAVAAGDEAASELTTAQSVLAGVLMFAFYFVSYAIMVYFNVGLAACAFQVVQGEEPRLEHGFGVATSRLPQILGWAALSAVVGTILNAIENANETAAAIVAGLLGSAWTALTFFVVPVLVIEGRGPIGAIKGSASTLRATWGTAMVGNFSLGILTFIFAIPIVLVTAGLVAWAVTTQLVLGVVVAVGFGVIALASLAAFSSAADVVFKALLYNFATNRAMPAGIDTSHFREAFRPAKR